jgi:hypothetical protein
MKWLIPITFAAALAGCRGDRVKCEKAARNYHQLKYWKKAEAEIAAAPPEKRDQMRKDAVVKFEHEEEVGTVALVTRCVAANDDDTVNCLIEAKTAEQADACADKIETTTNNN